VLLEHGARVGLQSDPPAETYAKPETALELVKRVLSDG
jgi:hypothetical protein